MCTVQCILRTVPVYYAQCTIYIVPCTLYHVQCTIEYVLCKMYNVQCVQSIQHSGLFTEYKQCLQSNDSNNLSVLSALSVSVYLPGPPPTPPNQETRDIA